MFWKGVYVCSQNSRKKGGESMQWFVWVVIFIVGYAAVRLFLNEDK